MLAGLPATISEPWWVTDRRWRKTFRKSFKNEPGHRDPLIQNQGGKLCLGSFISLWLWKGPSKFIWFQKFVILSTKLYPFHKTQVIHKAGSSVMSKTRSTSGILQHFSNSCIPSPSPVSSISFSTSPRQPSKTQPATSTPEKVGEAWREYQALFLCPKQNWCSLQYYTGHYYFQTAQIDRGALCLKKISSINQCIMDVEQISWAAIPDNQEQIIRYAALHRINVVYQ